MATADTQHCTYSHTTDMPSTTNKITLVEHQCMLLQNKSGKITRFQRQANCINMLRHWWKCFNFQSVKVDTQVPWNYILICNDNITCWVVVVNETYNTARWTTITYHSTQTMPAEVYVPFQQSIPYMSQFTQYLYCIVTTTFHSLLCSHYILDTKLFMERSKPLDNVRQKCQICMHPNKIRTLDSEYISQRNTKFCYLIAELLILKHR